MLKTYRGSCHCGAVRFEANLDLRAPTYRCNCSICSRTRSWVAVAKAADFRLLSGQDHLTRYSFTPRGNEHYFCKTCGIRSFGIGRTPDGEQMYGVNVGCLDGTTPEELAAAPIVYVDGKHDKHTPPPITSYL
jgi:hypothetical protein